MENVGNCRAMVHGRPRYAFTVGYGSASALSRAFRTQVGQTPTE